MDSSSGLRNGLQGITFESVSSLFKMSLLYVVQRIPLFLSDVDRLPPNVKDKLLYLMSKRGLITDTNITKLVHDNVKVLDLSDCDVSDEALPSVEICKSLKKIDLNSAKQSRTNITSTGIESLAHSCKQLQVVYLRRCLNLTDSAVVALAQCCPLLRELNIGGCELITDASLQALGQNLRFLKNINFSKSKVTDIGVLSLVSGPCQTSLQEIHMDGCVLLTDDAVEAVCQFCHNITILLFHGCPKISDRSRQAMEDMAIENNTRIKQVTWTVY